MAHTLEILSTKDTFKLIVDGNEIEGVSGYQLSESGDGITTLSVQVVIAGQVEVTVEK